MTKVIYCCPFAHYSGHHPHVANIEPEALQDAGNEVILVTFQGLIDNMQPNVKQVTVIPRSWHKVKSILHKLRQVTIIRWLMMLMENQATIAKAIWFYTTHKYDVIHLRDGDPFLFTPLLNALPLLDVKWAISVTGSVLYAPTKRGIYSLAIKFISSNIWYPLYRFTMACGNVTLMPQNKEAAKGFSSYLKGVFRKHITVISRGVDKPDKIIEKFYARNRLGLPLDEFILLSFGAPHQGKSMETIFEALAIEQNTYLIQAGKHTYSINGSIAEMIDKNKVNDKCKVYSYFIPEQDKALFFGAADAILLSYTKIFASTSSMLLEAAKFGKPVIASDNYLLGKDVKEYELGALFEAESSKDLAKAITEFKRNYKPTDLEVIKANCARYVKEHGIDKWAKECEAVYDKLLGKEVESEAAKQLTEAR
jgi:glycosyltransferase involved in cell wall biosynthesis